MAGTYPPMKLSIAATRRLLRKITFGAELYWIDQQTICIACGRSVTILHELGGTIYVGTSYRTAQGVEHDQMNILAVLDSD